MRSREIIRTHRRNRARHQNSSCVCRGGAGGLVSPASPASGRSIRAATVKERLPRNTRPPRSLPSAGPAPLPRSAIMEGCRHCHLWMLAKPFSAPCERGARCPRSRKFPLRMPPGACWRRTSPPTAIRPRWRARCAMATRCAPSICRASSRWSAKCARASDSPGEVGPGQAVEIMTGAPIPAGADAVVMIEHTGREDGRVSHRPRRRSRTSSSIRKAARRRRTRSCCTPASAWITPTSPCWRRSAGRASRSTGGPVVAIIATGDEIVEVDETPEEFQIRNSNAYSLAAQVARAGGDAPDSARGARHRGAHARDRSRSGLDADLLLLSGGVSAGKYDVVEEVLAGFGARILFRPRADPAGPAAGLRPRRRKVLLRPAGQSLVHHGDVRDLRARRAGTARRAGGDRAAHALRAPDARIPPPHRPDALSAGAPERRWRRGDAGGVARLGRHPGADPRQRLPGGRSRPRRVCCAAN